MRNTPTSCWACGHVNPSFVLSNVRLMKCKGADPKGQKCTALLPSQTFEEFTKVSRELNLPHRQRVTL